MGFWRWPRGNLSLCRGLKQCQGRAFGSDIIAHAGCGSGGDCGIESKRRASRAQLCHKDIGQAHDLRPFGLPLRDSPRCFVALALAFIASYGSLTQYRKVYDVDDKSGLGVRGAPGRAFAKHALCMT